MGFGGPYGDAQRALRMRFLKERAACPASARLRAALVRRTCSTLLRKAGDASFFPEHQRNLSVNSWKYGAPRARKGHGQTSVS
jgi:hypothetical protein